VQRAKLNFLDATEMHDGDHEAQWRLALQHSSHEEEDSRDAGLSS
jgi:hypothetical protein